MNWEKVKNWVFGGAGAVALVVFYQFMQWQVSIEVDRQLAARDLGTDTNIVNIKSNVQENKRTGEENAEDIAENKQAVRDAFLALIGEQ